MLTINPNPSSNLQSELLPTWLRMNQIATTAERKSRTYITKDGEIRHVKGRSARKGLLPLGESTIWNKVREGTFPKPYHLSNRITAWKLEDIIQWCNSNQ